MCLAGGGVRREGVRIDKGTPCSRVCQRAWWSCAAAPVRRGWSALRCGHTAGTAARHRQDRYRPLASDDELFKALGHLAIAAPGRQMLRTIRRYGRGPLIALLPAASPIPLSGVVSSAPVDSLVARGQ